MSTRRDPRIGPWPVAALAVAMLAVGVAPAVAQAPAAPPAPPPLAQIAPPPPAPAAAAPLSADDAAALAARATDRIKALQREAEQLAAQSTTLLGQLRQLEVTRALRAEELSAVTARLTALAAKVPESQ